MSEKRAPARALVAEYLAQGQPLGWFEPFYRSAAGDVARISWADLRPNPNLLEWLDAHAIQGDGQSALVVGCGLGDDAEELAGRGFNVTGFDIAPTAIAWCRDRFPASRVKYEADDLLDPPDAWKAAFSFVFEAYTLQVLPPEQRQIGMKQLASFLKPGGRLLIVARAREPGDPKGEMPWPLTQAELSQFQDEGLILIKLEDYLDRHETPPVRRFRAVYENSQ